MTVKVVVLLPVDREFTYRVPEPLQAEVQRGSRVVVPFGARRLTGVVTGVGSEEGDFKDLVDVLDDEPAVTPDLLNLTRWIADYYVCGWGEAIRAALPAGIEVESKQQLMPGPNRGPDDDKGAGLVSYVAAHPGVTPAQAQRALGSGASSSLISRLQEAGRIVVQTRTAAPRVRALRRRFVRLSEAMLAAGMDQIDALAPGQRQRLVLTRLFAYAEVGQTEIEHSVLVADAGGTSTTISGLAQRGLIEVNEREVLRTPLGEWPLIPEVEKERTLHTAQIAAVETILSAVETGRFETFLLHGVTGSGKTEVYIQVLRRVLHLGKTGIVLVPEIALTPQTVQRFRASLGQEVEVLHSRMSAGERYDSWRALRRGDVRVAIGPRSAVLAPLSDIGLIVVDEEHESSYKQFDPAPRYHARDVAVVRAQQSGAVCILGSATPSMESIRNVSRGKYALLSMPERVPVDGGPAARMPDIRMVDLGLEHKKHRLNGVLSEALREAIAARLEREEQVILLQNRRGYAGILECQDCGWTPHCRDCAVTLTVHKKHRHLRCHYCGATRAIPAQCPECGSEVLRPHGVGTQRVEEELASLFPEARLLRMDLDTTRRKNAHREILSGFRRGKADILVGTQMVAKGLDFERVTLVGVVNADTGLLLPDFRSAERSFQMLTQVAGRSGRSRLHGEVILQTRNPDHPVLLMAAAHDVPGFIAAELPERERLGYPPYGRLIGLEFRGSVEQTVRDLARSWTAELRKQLPDLPILGPEPAFVARIKRSYRFQTMVKVPQNVPASTIKARIRDVEDAFGRPPADCRIVIDIDPYGLF